MRGTILGINMNPITKEEIEEVLFHINIYILIFDFIINMESLTIRVTLNNVINLATDLCLIWPKVLNLVTVRGFMKNPELLEKYLPCFFFMRQTTKSYSTPQDSKF